MTDDLLLHAIQNPNTPARAHHCRTHWLPQVIDAKTIAQYDGMADTYVADLHPDIYHHGPHHAKVAQHLTHLAELLTTATPALYGDLRDLAITFTNFYNNHNDEFKDNPDFAYRECNTYDIDIKIPGYQDCMTNQCFVKWVKLGLNVTKHNIDEVIMIDAYKISLTCWDVFEPLTSFQQTKTRILTIQERWDFPTGPTP